MPQHHPVNVAARVALLDHLSHGRVYWGFGQGGVPTDWELFGLPDGKTQGHMTAEARDIWRVSRSIFVGESNDEAWDFCMNGAFGASFHYLRTLLNNAEMLDLVKHDPAVPDEDVTLEYIFKNLCIIGDRKSCIEQLECLWEETDGFGTLLFTKHDFDDAEQWNRCVHELVEHVVPALPSV